MHGSPGSIRCKQMRAVRDFTCCSAKARGRIACDNKCACRFLARPSGRFQCCQNPTNQLATLGRLYFCRIPILEIWQSCCFKNLLDGGSAVVTGAPIAVAASNKNNRANNPTPAGILFSDPQIKPSSTTGQQRAGAYLLFFLTGTLTPANVYADGLLTTPLSQTPGSSQFSCTADSAGRFNPIYLDPAVIYRVQFFNSVGVKLDDTDPYISGGLASISAETIGKFIYPKTAAEISLSVTPTNFQYPADPCIDPRRYGADPTGVSDSTTAVQTALNVAYTANGCVSIGNACNFLVGPLSVTITGAANRGIRILGSSLVGSALTAKSSICGALLTFTTSNPATTLVESFVILEHFSVYSGAPVMGQHGISIQGVGSWQLSNVRVSGFDHGLSVVSSLVGIVNDGSQFLDNNTGVSISLSGSTNTTNLIRIQDCRINLNALWGIDYNGGSELQLRGNDIEANGTSQTITFATSPGGGGSTTMPNLSAVWAHETHIYAINLSTGQVVYCLLTNGSAAVGAANVGATGSPTTAATTGYGGGVVIRAGISPDLEEGNVRFDSNWLEANNWARHLHRKRSRALALITSRFAAVRSSPRKMVQQSTVRAQTFSVSQTLPVRVRRTRSILRQA